MAAPTPRAPALAPTPGAGALTSTTTFWAPSLSAAAEAATAAVGALGRRASRFGRFRRLALGRFGALLRLVAHVFLNFGAHAQQLVERHAVQIGQGNEVPHIGRRLGPFPFGNGLARQPQLLGQALLGKAALTAQLGKALGNLHVHHGSLSCPACGHCSPFTLWFPRKLHQHPLWSISKSRGTLSRQPAVAPYATWENASHFLNDTSIPKKSPRVPRNRGCPSAEGRRCRPTAR
jgi:hypothetical protein